MRKKTKTILLLEVNEKRKRKREDEATQVLLTDIEVDEEKDQILMMTEDEESIDN